MKATAPIGFVEPQLFTLISDPSPLEAMTFTRGDSKRIARTAARPSIIGIIMSVSRSLYSTLDKLPLSLSLEVQLYLNRGILTKVPFFKDADEVFIREIIPKLRHHTFLPGDLIMRQGEYGDCMYFINSGNVTVLINNEQTAMATLEAGSHVGEMSLIAGAPRNASVRSDDYCEVYELSKDRFDELRAKYPKFDARVKEVVAEREAANKQRQ